MQEFAMNKVVFAYDGLEDAFPEIDPGVKPLGSRVVVQIRRAKRKTKGGIILAEDSRDTEQWNTQVAKVVAIGPLAYKNRTTMEPWPEGAWVQIGSFIRAPKYGGDRWSVATEDGEIVFAMFNDMDILGEITGDPLAMKAFL
jgi:co-chaperonin GroES (HSP10)